jgi:hypothetical protein
MILVPPSMLPDTTSAFGIIERLRPQLAANGAICDRDNLDPAANFAKCAHTNTVALSDTEDECHDCGTVVVGQSD